MATGAMAQIQDTTADLQAGRNWSANLRSLANQSPEVVHWVESVPAHVQWAFGRDGQLTGQTDGRWWQGCSVPRAAAQKILQGMNASACVSIFLDPRHSAFIRVALDKLSSSQAIIAVVPDLTLLRVLLATDDFSADIRSNRLWFVVGETWADQFAQLLESHAGLVIPTQFIRTRWSDEALLELLIATTQARLATVMETRAKILNQLSARRGNSNKVCVIAPSGFRVWDMGATVLGEVLSKNHVEHVVYDPNDPLSASPVALASVAAECGSVLSFNLARHQIPGVVHPETPWISWLTSPIALGQPGPFDAVIAADETTLSFAQASGMAPERLSLGTWPAWSNASVENQRHGIAVICDTVPVLRPKNLDDFSSNQILWEKIEFELTRDPLQLQGDVILWLRKQQAELGVPDDNVDVAMFIEKLIVPLYQQQLARMLVGAKIPVALYGRGWDEVESLAAYSHGAVESMDQLRRICAESAALLYPYPMKQAHPIFSVGKPVVLPDRNSAVFISRAKAVLTQPTRIPPVGVPLTIDQLKKFMPIASNAR